MLLGGTALAVGRLDPAPGSAADHAATAASGYTPHYLVFGTRDASGTPRMLALDFNRTERDDGSVAYKSKLFVGRGADWSMPVYETRTTALDAEAPRFPARGSLDPTLTNDGILHVTADFAYQQATEALPPRTRNVLVRWTATAHDETAQQHRSTAWLVDVLAWEMRVQLRRRSEHRGHGSPRDDGTRPIYVQAGVEGRGLIRGEAHRVFGMVEHIRE